MVSKRYIPFGNDLSVESALIQSAQMLEHASRWAVENRDAGMMTNVAAGWMELSVRLSGYVEEQTEREEMELSSQPGYQMGFQPNLKDEDDEDDSDEEFEPSEVDYPEPDEDI